MRIVVFKVNRLGDNVACVPAVQALRRMRPDWRVTLLTTDAEAELYGGPLGPQEIVTTSKREFDSAYRRPWELASWVRRIRRLRPDACVLPFDQGNMAHLLAWWSGARIRAGSLNNARFRGSVTDVVPLPAGGNAASWNWASAVAAVRRAGGAEDWPAEPPAPDLAHLLRGPRVAPGTRRRIVVHPGANGLNRWPVDRFAEAARTLSRDFEVLWIRHGERAPPAPQGAAAADVRSLADFAAAVADACLFLGNNSGPMHVANALGVPGVVVTGPSATGWDPQWHRGSWTVLRQPGLYCAPCERLDRAVSTCVNTGHPMACLDLMAAERVVQACLERIGTAPKIP